MKPIGGPGLSGAEVLLTLLRSASASSVQAGAAPVVKVGVPVTPTVRPEQLKLSSAALQGLARLLDAAGTGKPLGQERAASDWSFEELHERVTEGYARYHAFEGIGSFRSAYGKAVHEAHFRSDDTVQYYKIEISNILEMPSAAEIDEDYERMETFELERKALGCWTHRPDVLAAVQARTIRYESAFDIADLNFTNTIIFESGAGQSVNDRHSYNRDAAIFHDPTRHYSVASNGVVMSWPRLSAA